MSKWIRFGAIAFIVGIMVVATTGCQLVGGGRDFPSRSIDGTIAWGAGGGTDTSSRLLASIAETKLGQSITMTNLDFGR
ncbi:MAG: hypothetical protein KGZ64_12935 [Thermaerobacter sp.]|nr:hypothetical protein [Thermaerobacter sp.]